MHKILCLLATKKGLEVLSSTIRVGKSDILGCVMTFTEKISKDYESEIKRECIKRTVPHVKYTHCEGSELIESTIDKYKITAIIAIGWRFLLPLSLNDRLTIPIIVFHDSLLPKYRGFSPTPTAMICGEKTVGVTALYASEGTDEGEIIWQKEVPIAEDDYIQRFRQYGK